MHKQIRHPAPIEINARTAYEKKSPQTLSFSVLLQPGYILGGEW